jgi:hypothetical protein
MTEETALAAYSLFKAAVFTSAVVCLTIAAIGYLYKKYRGQ